MREQLRPLLDQMVHTMGTIACHRQRPDGLFDVCLEEVEVRPVDLDRPLLATEPVALDHLWLIAPAQVYKIGTRTSGMGRVHLYARAGGSVDLGVRHVDSCDLGNLRRLLLVQLEDCRSLYERASLVRAAVETAEQALAGGVLVEINRTISTRQSLRDLQALSARLDRNSEANLTRLLQSHPALHRGTTRRERRTAERQARRAPLPFLGATA